MVKILLSMLLTLLWTYFWLPPVHATTSTDEMSIDIKQVSESEFEGLLSVELGPDTQKAPITRTKLTLSDSFVSGFVSASAGGGTLDCQKSGNYVDCDLSGSDEWDQIDYSFKWSQRLLIEIAMCANRDGQLLESKYPYIKEYGMEVEDDHPFVRTIKISKVSTSGNVKNLFADIVTDNSYAILWGTKTFEGGGELGPLEFVADSATAKLTGEQTAKSGTFRPHLGSLGDFKLVDRNSKNIRLTIIDTTPSSISISSVEMQTCKVEDITTQSITTKPIHTSFFENGDPSIVEGRFLTVDWSRVSYEMAEPTHTPTPTPTYTPIPTNTSIPTPTLVKIVSSTSATSSPTPTSQSSIPSITPIFTPTSAPSSGGLVGTSTDLSGSRSGNVFADVAKNVLGIASSAEESRLEEGRVKGGKSSGDESQDAPKNMSDVVWGLVIVMVGIGVISITAILIKKKSLSLKNIFRLLLIASLYCMVSRPAYAQSQSPTSYKITDAFTMKGKGTLGYVTNFKTFLVTRSEVPGKYVVSRNPDGTGDATIGNYLQAIVHHTYWSSTKTYWVGPATVTYSDFYKCPDNTTVPPQNASSWFHSSGTYSLMFRFITSCNKYFPVSDLYLVFIPDAPTPTPTITPTPTPTPFTPFLELPWDYKSDKLTFTQAATAINSYFDHEYPLLSKSVVGLADPDVNLVIYTGEKLARFYTKHDGYDYGSDAKASLMDPQLAAADGEAEYRKNLDNIGNAIFIDHGNRFQTRYYHLDDKDLLTTEFGKKISVKQGQMIGRIGATGNSDGPHIHFMVVYDKNNDGQYDDNIPDGLIDPFGWQGDEGHDPWENATFELPKGVARTGMRSSYLWKRRLADVTAQIGPEGGDILADGISIYVPKLTLEQILDFHMKSVPRPPDMDGLESLSAGIKITAKDDKNILVRYFNNPFNLIIDIAHENFKIYKPESIKIYSSSDDGATWNEDPTYIDQETGRAVGTINHLTLFALFGEKVDKSSPVSTIEAAGFGKGKKFRSNVKVSVAVEDDIDSLGVDYSMFTLDSEYDWTKLESVVEIASEGAHIIKVFSADKSGNIEVPKELTFTIDKRKPEMRVEYSRLERKLLFSVVDGGDILSETGNEVAVEDDAGNVRKLKRENKAIDGLEIYKFAQVKDAEETPSEVGEYLYVVDSTREYAGYEYFSSGSEEVRMVVDADGKPVVINENGIDKENINGPLLLQTVDGKLKIEYEKDKK